MAHLEGKIDGLYSLLAVGRVPQVGIGDIPSPIASGSSSNTSPSPRASHSASTAAAASGTLSLFPPEFNPSPQEAEERLANFRDNMLKYLPFLQLSRDTQQLRRERPFVFLCIMHAASSAQSTQTKLALGEVIRRTVTQRVFLETEPGAVNIDLLLGLLTFLAWGNDHLVRGTATGVSRFTHLAMTLVFDMRLNKPLLPDESNMLPVGSHVNGRPTSANAAPSGGPARPSMEERRAVLACFFMSSMVSSYLGHIDAMQWTPYMEECLRVLTTNSESPHDEIFVHQIRLQRIAGDIEAARGAGASTAASLPFYVSAVRRNVDEVKAQISPYLEQDPILLASIYYTELSTFGLLLSATKHSHSSTTTLDLQRLEYLHGCLETVKSAVENVFKIPPAEYPCSSFPFFVQLARCLVVLYRLSTLNDPVWDTSLVRSTLGVLQVTDQMISNMQQCVRETERKAQAADGENSSGGGFLDLATRIFIAFKSWCAARLDESVDTPGRTGGRAQAPSTSSGSQCAGGRGMLLDLPPPFDDLWLNDRFTSGFLEGTNFVL
ncbi:hypothetical protein MKZ38_005794 [Zalerion maritima]|uniref:Uncharacterized protein n=1 Tax=Zalerion maritima TaxID=339359 RepID=A0AAD5RXS4_9PEZI|nr:hypothetical protein MKZ38_005794 [Zalerion maritima]